jgi:hypothetical protein
MLCNFAQPGCLACLGIPCWPRNDLRNSACIACMSYRYFKSKVHASLDIVGCRPAVFACRGQMTARVRGRTSHHVQKPFKHLFPFPSFTFQPCKHQDAFLPPFQQLLHILKARKKAPQPVWGITFGRSGPCRVHPWSPPPAARSGPFAQVPLP